MPVQRIGYVLPGTKGASWPWTSLSRTIRRKGVAPDHVPRIVVLTVLASLNKYLRKEKHMKRLHSGHVAKIISSSQELKGIKINGYSICCANYNKCHSAGNHDTYSKTTHL